LPIRVTTVSGVVIFAGASGAYFGAADAPVMLPAITMAAMAQACAILRIVRLVI
jgi:hypothetical protein